jgi:hypothetical protein
VHSGELAGTAKIYTWGRFGARVGILGSGRWVMVDVGVLDKGSPTPGRWSWNRSVIQLFT